MTQVPLAKFDSLPPELYLPIARISVVESGYDIRDIFRVSNINSRMRNVVTNTPDLWRKFTLSSATSSHKIGRLCVSRSRSHTLDLLIALAQPMVNEKPVYSFLKCFNLAAPRIARLSVRISHPSSLNIVNPLLSKVELPALKDIDADYDNEVHEGLDRWIMLPSHGANLRSITLTGVQMQPFSQLDLANLTSLSLGTGKHWKWMSMSIATLLPAATSLQELHFVGERGPFHTYLDDEWDDDVSFTFPNLRRVRFTNTAPGFLVPFLREMNAPILEEVDMTTPPRRTYNEEGEEVFAGWIAAVRSIVENPALALPAHTLKLRQGGVKYNPQEMFTLALFLMGMFPNITSLEIEGGFLSILPICSTLADRETDGAPGVWRSVERLKLDTQIYQNSHEGVEYGEFLIRLIGSLQLLKEKGMMNLRELRLSADQSLQSPKGRVTVAALSEIVEVLILED
ncbi:hypothetical protein FS837_010397 [Tulasnella sp. UAMH 9824]|nr:hypothetical protein FS837_010397 [Tulasnella sp. UAMH 9824]